MIKLKDLLDEVYVQTPKEYGDEEFMQMTKLSQLIFALDKMVELQRKNK